MRTIKAAAKVNLNLAVTGRDDQNYHHLLSLVVFTEFGDELSFAPANNHLVTLSGTFASDLEKAGGEQLLAKAIALYQEITADEQHYHIKLVKQIPLGGGLGGGSADAGALLRSLCTDNALSETVKQRIRQASVRLGADVPACFDSQMQIISSIGEVPFYCPAPDWYPEMVLVNPHCHADTKSVFSAYANQQPGFSTLDQDSLAKWVKAACWDKIISAGNDLTRPALTLYPAIEDMLLAMSEKGRHYGSDFIGCSMTGSGASAFALFQNRDKAKAYATDLQKAGLWAVHTAMKQL